MKCYFCKKELKYDFEKKVGVCELCQIQPKRESFVIKNFEDFKSIDEGLFRRKLPDFEMNAKVKKIIIDIDGDKIKALAGARNGYCVYDDHETYEDTFYFKTDKKNTDLLKKHSIKSIDMIDTKKNTIKFDLNNDEKMECSFKIKFFSRRDIGEDWDEAEEGGYVSWNLSDDNEY